MKKYIYNYSIAIFSILFCLSGSAFAQDLVKLYNSPLKKETISASAADNSNEWKSFASKNGLWSITIDKATGTPAIAYGKPITIISPADMGNDDKILSALKSFILSNKSVFKIDINSLQLNRISKVGNKTYISFSQQFEGIKVLFTDIQFVLNAEGQVFRFNITYFDNIVMPAGNNLISPQKATELTNISLKDKISEIKYIDKIEELQSNPQDEMYILPVYAGSKVNYHKAYLVNSRDNKINDFNTYIDAYSGKVLWQYNKIKNINKEIQFKVNTIPKLPMDKAENFPLAFAELADSNNIKYTADKDGKFTISSDISKLTFSNSTKYAKVSFRDKSDKVLYASPTVVNVTPDAKEIILSGEGNNKYVAFALHHFEILRNYLNDQDTKLKFFEKQFPIYFSENSSMGANAYYDPANNSMCFVDYKNSTNNLPTCASVLYHEMGHMYSHNFCKQVGKTDFVNSSCDEALADINSALIMDDPIVGLQYSSYNINEYIRNCDNKNTYPDSTNIDSHYNGLILSGSIWDLRKSLGIDETRKLLQLARYSLADDTDDGLAFSKWFLAFLEADDNNGNLTDGTPNFSKIVTAFNNHNIGLNLVLCQNLKFTPPDDLSDYHTPQKFKVEFDKPALPCVLPDKIKLNYWYEENAVNTVILNKIGEVYEGEIPGFTQEKNVHYYFDYIDNNSNSKMSYTHSKPNVLDNSYNTGFKSIFKDDFENSAFTISSSQTFGGDFEIAEPTEYYMQILAQPGFSMSKSGNKCLCTGAESNNSIPPVLIKGKTEATSPVIQIPKGYKNLYLNLWSFEFAYYSANTKDLKFSIAYKTDNMINWDTTYRATLLNMMMYMNSYKKLPYSARFNVWKKLFIPIKCDITNSGNIQFKLIAENNNKQMASFLNILIDDFEVLATDGSSSAEDNQQANGEVSCLPNPFKDNTNIRINSRNEATAECNLYDVLGNVQASPIILNINEGINEFNFENLFGNNFASGIYFLKVNINGSLQTLKIMKI